MEPSEFLSIQATDLGDELLQTRLLKSLYRNTGTPEETDIPAPVRMRSPPTAGTAPILTRAGETKHDRHWLGYSGAQSTLWILPWYPCLTTWIKRCAKRRTVSIMTVIIGSFLGLHQCTRLTLPLDFFVAVRACKSCICRARSMPSSSSADILS